MASLQAAVIAEQSANAGLQVPAWHLSTGSRRSRGRSDPFGRGGSCTQGKCGARDCRCRRCWRGIAEQSANAPPAVPGLHLSRQPAGRGRSDAFGGLGAFTQAEVVCRGIAWPAEPGRSSPSSRYCAQLQSGLAFSQVSRRVEVAATPFFGVGSLRKRKLCCRGNAWAVVAGAAARRSRYCAGAEVRRACSSCSVGSRAQATRAAGLGLLRKRKVGCRGLQASSRRRHPDRALLRGAAGSGGLYPACSVGVRRSDAFVGWGLYATVRLGCGGIAFAFVAGASRRAVGYCAGGGRCRLALSRAAVEARAQGVCSALSAYAHSAGNRWAQTPASVH
jgi:hypothetical protein